MNQSPALNVGGLLLAGLDALCTLWGTSTLWGTRDINIHANAATNAAATHAPACLACRVRIRNQRD